MSKRTRRAGAEASATTATPGALERYRLWLIAVVVVAVVAVIGFVALSSTSAADYTCESLLQAPPGQTTFTLADFDGELPGFPTSDDGRNHSDGSISYASCPPTSGEHRAEGELPRELYGPEAIQVPNDWVHNLEHGYAVIVYQGDPGTEVLDQIQGIMDTAAPSDIAVACGLPNKVIAVRFDEMSEPFAVVAWQRALLLQQFDPELVAATVDQFQDLPQTPERAC
jgi:hypothetical protein